MSAESGPGGAGVDRGRGRGRAGHDSVGTRARSNHEPGLIAFTSSSKPSNLYSTPSRPSFERLASILQGYDSNYDTDIFAPLFAAITLVTGAAPYTGKVGPADAGYKDMAYRVVADHLRTLTFAIADGAVPSNDGRGYVLRRVLRRAVRYGRQNLGADLGFFSKLVPTLVRHMGDAFPEIRKREAFVVEVIREEEDSFSRTLDKGLAKFDTMCPEEGGTFEGKDAHFLYTTMGFPKDLTELMCEERGVTFDGDGFEAKMREEVELSAAARKAKMSGGAGKEMVLEAEQTARLAGVSVGATGQEDKYAWHADIGATCMACFLGRGETEDKVGFVEAVGAEDGAVGLVFDKTNYYAEQGGQIYDQGTIVSDSGAVMRVDSVQVFGGYVLHLGSVVSGKVRERRQCGGVNPDESRNKLHECSSNLTLSPRRPVREGRFRHPQGKLCQKDAHRQQPHHDARAQLRA